MKRFVPPIACILVAVAFLAAPDRSQVPSARAASDFLCPSEDIDKTIASFKETPADLAAATDALKGAERENAISVIINNLKKKYPGAQKADIVNYILTAYCPIVAAEGGLGADEKRARMQQFSSQVLMILGE